MDIDTILTRIRAGDRQAFAHLVTQFQGPLFGFLGNMGLSQRLVEELAQETFLRAWTHLGQYRPDLSQFSTWLFTIARNLALHEIGSAPHRREIPEEPDMPEPFYEQPDPDAALGLEQRRRLLHAALRRLSPADRSVLALAYLRDMTLDEVARIEACSLGAVKVRLHRAKARLTKLLEDHHA